MFKFPSSPFLFDKGSGELESLHTVLVHLVGPNNYIASGLGFAVDQHNYLRLL